MIDKAIIVFGPDGIGASSMDWPWNDEMIALLESEGARYAILDRNFPDAYWMDDNEDCYLREAITISLAKPRIVADGMDETEVEGLPQSCSVMVGNDIYNVDDGELILATPEPGDLAIRLVGLHKSNVIVLSAVSLDSHKTEAKARINAAREIAMATAPTSLGYTFDSKPNDKININGVLSGIMALGVENHPDIQFRMADDTVQTLTPTQFVQASLEVSAYLNSVYVRSWALKAHVDTLDEIEDIEGVTWDTDLP